MPIRKRNEFLDIDGSEEDASAPSDHEGITESRTAGLVSRKRPKITITSSASDDEGVLSEPDDNSADPISTKHYNDTLIEVNLPTNKSSTPLLPSLQNQTLIAQTSQSKHKPGVIYLSRIPPFMRPSTVKSLLSVYGSISKIFLTPEPPSTYLRRKKGGGNKKHSFIDGWVEFARKKHAKQCVDAINGQIVGGKKGGWYRDDVWNARYLRGFGWDDLMQSVRAEEREREERVRVGTKREGRERGEFLKNLERSKVEETRREKRRKREGNGSGGMDQDPGIGYEDGAIRKEPAAQQEPAEGKRKPFERQFRQNEVKADSSNKQPEQSEQVKRVLSKIF